MITPRRLAVFTTSSCNRLGMARALMATLRRHYPEADQFICIGDDPSSVTPPPGCRIVAGADIAVPDWRRTCFAYDAMALNCLLKPFMFLHLTETLGYDRVYHFDTDMALYDRLHSVDAALDAGASLVLTPHLLTPPAACDLPGPLEILRDGTYNAGFLAADRSDAAREALRWWAARVHADGGVAPERGLHRDQRWLDLMPGLFAGVHILRDPAVNAAYWNLPQRPLGHDAAGWTVAGQRLALFHFSGFDPADPTRLTSYATNLPTPPPTAIASLLAEYTALLDQHAEPSDPPPPYAFGHFLSGTPIPPAARALFHAQHRDWPTDPFDTFEAHLDAAAPTALSNELAAIYRSTSWRLTAPLRAIATSWRR